MYVACALIVLFLQSSGHFNTDPAWRTGVLVRRLRLERLTVMREAAGSSPVAPAIFFLRRRRIFRSSFLKVLGSSSSLMPQVRFPFETVLFLAAR